MPVIWRAVWTSAIPTVRYACMPAACAASTFELVVIKKDDTGRGTFGVGEDVLECRTSGLEVADLMRQVVVMQEAVEP